MWLKSHIYGIIKSNPDSKRFGIRIPSTLKIKINCLYPSLRSKLAVFIHHYEGRRDRYKNKFYEFILAVKNQRKG